MLKFLVFCSFFAFIRGGVVPEGSVDLHIVGGEDGNIKDLPYIVSMQRNSSHFCGGSIIAPNLILTASHCSRGRKASDLSFRAGSSRSNTNGTVVKVKAIHMHPKFDEKTLDYDVAVIELQTKLNFSETIKAIPIVDAEPKDGDTVRTSGWGHLKEGGKSTKILQTVEVPMVDRATCKKSYRHMLPVTSRMICAGIEGKDSCQGDSGGPLAHNGKLCGVVSFGSGCARKGFPGVYANLADPEISSFIKEFM